MFLNGQKAEGCLKINCLPVGRTADTTALRLAMCYANEKKKTLLIDLNATDSDDASLSDMDMVYTISQSISYRDQW